MVAEKVARGCSTRQSSMAQVREHTEFTTRQYGLTEVAVTLGWARSREELAALCQGILTCGSCGKPMRTNYHIDQRLTYECSRTPMGSPQRPADLSPRPRWTTRSPAGYCRRSTPPRSHSPWPATGHQRISRAAELAVEGARYEADRLS